VPLGSLAAYGDTAEVNDLSADICNPKAAKVRSETRDDAGRTIMHSPYIHEMDHPPQYVLAGLIPGSEPAEPAPAAGKSAAGEKTLANVPVPVPRPTF